MAASSSVPHAFAPAFEQLRKMHAQLCTSVALQTPIIESLILQAHESEVAKLHVNGVCSGQVPEQCEAIPSEHHWLMMPNLTSQSDTADGDNAMPLPTLARDRFRGKPTPSGSFESTSTLGFSSRRQGSMESMGVVETQESFKSNTSRVTLNKMKSNDSMYHRRKSRFSNDSDNLYPASGNYYVIGSDESSVGGDSMIYPCRGSLLSFEERDEELNLSRPVSIDTGSGTDRSNASLKMAYLLWQARTTRRWAQLVEKIIQLHLGSKVVVRGEWCHAVQHPERKRDPTPTISRSLYMIAQGSESSQNVLTAGSTVRNPHSNAQSCFFHPDGVVARLMLIMGSMCLTWDFVTVPYVLCFAVSDNVWVVLDFWFTLFWSCDMMISSLTGYYARDFVEMRPTNVILHYFKTWGLLDLVLVVSDWTGVVMMLADQGDQQQAWMSVGKVLKYYRFLRVLRMFRLLKLIRVLKSYFDGLATEVTAVMGRLLGLILFILTINHYIACLCCAMGRYNYSDEMTWIKAAKLEDEENSYQYAVALHWAMTQFTPATNNVNPTNLRERCFAFLVVLFALIVFSSFLGSLTQAISQLKQIHITRYSEESGIRRFIFERQVSMRCARGIWNFYRSYHRTDSGNIICIHDVKFFGKLPRMLRMALHEDISVPIIHRNWALYYLNCVNHDSCLLVCEAALSEVAMCPQQEIFNTGSSAECMIILATGSVSYTSDTFESYDCLHGPQLICEVAMWGHWLHAGSMMAIASSHGAYVDAVAFGKCIRSSTDASIFGCMCRYAHAFISRLNEEGDDFKVGDIIDPLERTFLHRCCQEIAREAFGDLAPERVSQKRNSQVRLSLASAGVAHFTSLRQGWRKRTAVVVSRIFSSLSLTASR